VKWTWDPAKEEANRQKHRFSFATAILVFDDPLALSRLDEYAYEERWQTIGKIDPNTIIVVHTLPEHEGDTGRIISARKATSHERKLYEEGNF
jgi:uncharacterized protein